MTEGSYQPPGWYHGEGDPPGTQRYWDGEMWIGDAVPSPNAGPPPPIVGSGAAPPTGPARYVESSNAVTALIMGIVGLVCCQVLSPVAWKIGLDELHGIDAGRRLPDNRGLALAGMVLGIIGTLLLALLAVGIMVALFAGAEA